MGACGSASRYKVVQPVSNKDIVVHEVPTSYAGSLSSIPENDYTIQDTDQAYVLLSDLVVGKGKFGIVVEGRSKGSPGIEVAIKTVRKREKGKVETSGLEEIIIWRTLDHPNIAKMLDTFDN